MNTRSVALRPRLIVLLAVAAALVLGAVSLASTAGRVHAPGADAPLMGPWRWDRPEVDGVA